MHGSGSLRSVEHFFGYVSKKRLLLQLKYGFIYGNRKQVIHKLHQLDWTKVFVLESTFCSFIFRQNKLNEYRKREYKCAISKVVFSGAILLEVEFTLKPKKPPAILFNLCSSNFVLLLHTRLRAYKTRIQKLKQTQKNLQIFYHQLYVTALVLREMEDIWST